ncbi:VanZ family protein [Desulfobulbus alkaliphilus]|uniref:VanZ family protein n=1 Tax=Desulfobulbus alkaliphilus TaxID=869814 RepID=UPI0019629260|nr:VanZ family protein [Desulfobulbus alkaliphilus]MBM9536981.1 VanZ family protein [Desulfobulbus alkaliphilus]
MYSLRRNWYRPIPLLLVMAMIFYQSHQPGDSFSLPRIAHIDKLLHLLVYTVLGLTALYALPPAWRQQYPARAGVVVVLFCLLHGIADEFHQSFIPGRFPSWADVVADTLGGVLAVIIGLGWQQMQTWRVARGVK